MEYKVQLFDNGIRLLFVPSASPISHACLLLNAGSRDENGAQMGLAHFIEHLLFKQTEKRSTQQILNRLESVGADLNAYTTKEYTCIHASFLHPYLDRTLELFDDIAFHSTFPEEELEKEKGVILDEIASYLDLPEEAIADDFEDLLFAGHALGRNILGTADSVNALKKRDIRQFMAQNYRTDEMVVAVLGNYDFKKVVKIATKYFANIAPNLPIKTRQIPVVNRATQQVVAKNINQSHCMMGQASYSLHHPNKVGLLLLNNWFGGNNMSSVLNLQIREKHGIAYSIESGYTPLSDTGLFYIYFGTDLEKCERAVDLIQKEVKKIRQQSFGTIRLHKAQQKFIGQIALGEENRIGLIIAMAKSLLDYHYIDSIETVFEKIRAVRVSDVDSIIDDTFDVSKWTSLTFIPASH